MVFIISYPFLNIYFSFYNNKDLLFYFFGLFTLYFSTSVNTHTHTHTHTHTVTLSLQVLNVLGIFCATVIHVLGTENVSVNKIDNISFLREPPFSTI